MTSPEPILDVAGDDPAASRQLSDALRIIAANSSDPALRDQISAVLNGDLQVRDFVRAEAFSQTLDRVMPAALEHYETMSEEERRRLAEQGETELERYRAALTDSGPPPVRDSSPPDAPAPSAPETTATPPVVPDAAAGHVVPGTRKPNRDLIVTPDEPDDDDLYYQDRQRRGWLE
ncbi:hypothetical protein [Nocardia cyriacigeorgica]|uniref:hypothetical protein n=1 Tax=Nocardia cyriacigeorgica TaxID=135487 RepID=UPI00245541BF|nr:hypothetical protein [Nocardia cyriacigeorgica]